MNMEIYSCTEQQLDLSGVHERQICTQWQGFENSCVSMDGQSDMQHVDSQARTLCNSDGSRVYATWTQWRIQTGSMGSFTQ